MALGLGLRQNLAFDGMGALRWVAMWKLVGWQTASRFGSAVVRVAPDTASIVVAVSRLEQKAEAAFAKAREGAQSVTAFLHKTGVKDFGSSRVTLSREFRYTNGENKFVGYQAKIEFNVILREMDKVDAVLSGLIAAGANTLTSVTFQTTRLKELRADARRRAVVAAREKADLYCGAAGVAVGAVLATEDVSPETLSGLSEGHTYREAAPVDDAGEPGAIDLGQSLSGRRSTSCTALSNPLDRSVAFIRPQVVALAPRASQMRPGRCDFRVRRIEGLGMPTIRLHVEPVFFGPASVGTVDLIQLVRERLGLSLSEAKACVDRCVRGRDGHADRSDK